MSPVENLYYAIGELAYIVAKADGHVQAEERRKFLQIINHELGSEDGQEKVGEIIFKLMDKRGSLDPLSVYDLAMQTIRTNSHYLSPELKEKFKTLLEKVAHAYPPITSDEQTILKKFSEDIAPLEGDPIYYGSG